MKKYDKYKDSGVEWIGDIPYGWKCLRNRFVCSFRNGYTPSKQNKEFWTNGSIPWYRMDDIRESGRMLKESKLYISPSAVNNGGLFEAGSFILATTATIGEHAMLIVDSLANQRFTNLKIRKSLNLSNEYFFYYLFLIDDFCKSTTKTATFPAVNMTDLKNVIILLPPISEQRAIALYLDKACAKIDKVIAAQQKRIELIKELRQNIISRAVTKGINRNVPMKDSGVEWIGEIPYGWKCLRLKYCAELNPKSDLYNLDKNDMVSFIPMECLRNDNITPIIRKYTEVMNYTSFQENDILVAKVTPCFENRNMAIATNLRNKRGFGSSEILVFRANELVNNRFLFFYLNSDYIQNVGVRSLTGTGGLKRISTNDLRDVKIPLPPISEQRAIVSYLNNKCPELDVLSSKAEQQIKLLEEYKQSLIKEVVTGKRKVF